MLKKLLLSLLLAAASLPSQAQETFVDGVRYWIDKSTLTASVGYLEYTDLVTDQANPTGNSNYVWGDIIIPESIIYDNDIYTVTSIGSAAFRNCNQLYSISLPKSIRTIENNAFEKCYGLNKVIWPESLETIEYSAFSECNYLSSVDDLPNLKKIGNHAFYHCTSLITIGNMPELTTIEHSAFYSCSSLKIIGELDRIMTIEAYAFTGTKLSEFYLPTSISSLSSSAFDSITFVHFMGERPPVFSGTSFSTHIGVPIEGYEYYKQALSDTNASYIIIDGHNDFDIIVTARENDSEIIKKVNDGYIYDMSYSVLKLKISGSINSYDILVLRNKLLNLRELDLCDATIVGSSFEYYSGSHTEDNIIGNDMFRDLNLMKIILPDDAQGINANAFNNCKHLISAKLPKFLKSIGSSAFAGCSSLKAIDIPQSVTVIDAQAFRDCSNIQELILPENLTTIGGGAFSGCRSLKEIKLPPLIGNIPERCFESCSSLASLAMPPTIKSIASRAFQHCYALKAFRIPAGVNSIGDGAIPYSVRDVYTYTIQPTTIGQNTFDSSTYLNATLHVLETSESLYYWDTQWSQFQSIENFNEPYSYFYLEDKDLIENPDTPRIDGETDKETGDKKNPDADLGDGSGLVVDGDKSQDLGNVDLEHDGNGDGASIIGGDSNSSESGGNVNIDMLNIKIPVLGKKWYFFAFPFDIELANIKFDGQMAWRYYDGEWRAMHGSGSWKDVTEDKLHRGRGYIFQGSKSGILTLSIPKAHFDAKDWIHELMHHASEFAQDASWNFIGNPFQSYYELADLGFDGPITWWNPNTNSYEAFSPLDDDLSMYPYMAFFVQKPEDCDGVEFFSRFRETRNQKNDPNHRSSARARRANRAERAKGTAERVLVNLTVTDGVSSDRTRVVFNSQASGSYEIGVDASKFVSGDAPQIYSIDASGVRYAINERPAGDGIVKLGFFAPAEGMFTIGCSRNDCPVTLKDCQTGMTVSLGAGETYEFNASAGYDDSRFLINAKADGSAALESVEAENDIPSTYYQINGIEADGSQPGLMIEVKGDKAAKVVRK